VTGVRVAPRGDADRVSGATATGTGGAPDDGADGTTDGGTDAATEAPTDGATEDGGAGGGPGHIVASEDSAGSTVDTRRAAPAGGTR
jgi:hypothetical protein